MFMLANNKLSNVTKKNLAQNVKYGLSPKNSQEFFCLYDICNCL